EPDDECFSRFFGGSRNLNAFSKVERERLFRKEVCVMLKDGYRLPIAVHRWRREDDEIRSEVLQCLRHAGVAHMGRGAISLLRPGQVLREEIDVSDRLNERFIMEQTRPDFPTRADANQ